MSALSLPGLGVELSSGATFSPCRRYRYRLHRQLEVGPARRVLFLMLNGSKANERRSDNTVTRCVNFTRSWGFNWLEVANLFGWMATDPRDLLTVEDPVGPDNDAAILAAAREASIVVCAWGTHTFLRRLLPPRARDVVAQLCDARIQLHILGTAKDGMPLHPLMQRADLKPVLWSGL